jgi:hypothetical protein
MRRAFHQVVAIGEAATYVALGLCYLLEAPHPVFAASYVAVGTFVVLHSAISPAK